MARHKTPNRILRQSSDLPIRCLDNICKGSILQFASLGVGTENTLIANLSIDGVIWMFQEQRLVVIRFWLGSGTHWRSFGVALGARSGNVSRGINGRDTQNVEPEEATLAAI